MRGDEPNAVYVITVTGGRKPKVQYELSEIEAQVIFDRLSASKKRGTEIKMRLFQPAALIATTNPQVEESGFFEEALEKNENSPTNTTSTISNA
jgi:hypothetical protein